MKANESSSASSTAGTSASGRKTEAVAQDLKHKALSKLSESEFLQKQADDASAAISATLNDISDSIKKALDVTIWTRQHPWVAAGAATAAGFVAACAFVPGKGAPPPARSRWGKVKAAWADVLHSSNDAKEEAEQAREKAEHEAESAAHAASKREPHEPWVATLLRELLKGLRPILISLLAGAMRPPQEHTDGHGADGHDASGPHAGAESMS